MKKSIKLRNIKTEICLIRAFCKCKRKGRASILDKVNEDSFGSNVGKLAWKRARILHTTKKLPIKGAWNILLADPSLSKTSIQDVLTSYEDAEVSRNTDYINELVSTLSFFRQKREACKAIEQAYDDLSEAKEDTEISGALIPVVSTARSLTDETTGDLFFRLDTLNIVQYLKDYKVSRDTGNIIRTLWPQFDAINQGFSFGNLVTIGATTGGGKSAVAGLNLMFNFALQGFKVANCSFEMPKEQIAERSAACISGIPLHKIRAWNLTEKEEEQIEIANDTMRNMIAKNGGAYWTLTPPDKDISIDEALTLAYEKAPDCILIDYINLLKKDPRQDLKDNLSEIARSAKMFAKANNCLVIILAQLNDDQRIKYAKAVEEHSDNVIIWEYPPDNRPGYIHVKQTKARNQVLFNFYLVEDFANMRIYDIFEPIGLALMLSRSSGKSYHSKTSEYFGLRRLIELNDTDGVGIPKHKFVEEIDWEDHIGQAVPPPNVPDVGTIMDMVREMVYQIAIYEPELAKAHVDNIKHYDILKPFREHIEDLDIPMFAKRALGVTGKEAEEDNLRKKELMDKIAQDLLSINQRMYVDADNLAATNRKDDIVTSRKKIYDDTAKRANGKKGKKELVDPETNKTKWMNMHKGYKNSQGLKVRNTPYKTSTGGGSPFDGISEDKKKALKRASKSKDSFQVFKQYLNDVLLDTPPSTESIREAMILDGSLPKISYLSAHNNDFLDAFEKSVDIVGSYLGKKVYKITSKTEIGVAEMLSTTKGGKQWKKGVKNERKLNTFAKTSIMNIALQIPSKGVIKSDLKHLPSVNDILGHFDLKKKTVSLLQKTSKKIEKTSQQVSGVPSEINPKEIFTISGNFGTPEQIKELLKKSKKVVKMAKPLMDATDSPFIVLYKHPELIGSITPTNLSTLNVPEFYIGIFKPKVFNCLKELNDNMELILKAVVWSVVNPDHRDDFMLFSKVRTVIMEIIGGISVENEVNSRYLSQCV